MALSNTGIVAVQLQDGEHAVIDIDRVGRLEFNVRDPLQRR